MDAFTNKLLTALMPNKARGKEATIMAAHLCLFCRQISLVAVCKLDQECLLCPRTSFDLIAVIEEKFKRIAGKRNVTKSDNVAFSLDNVHDFLKLFTAQNTKIRLQCSGVLKVDITGLFS